MIDTGRIYELSEIADEKLKNNEKVEQKIVNELKSLLSLGGFIGMAQINPIVGNLEYNSKKIANYIKYAENVDKAIEIIPKLIQKQDCRFENAEILSNYRYLEDLIKKYV